MAGDKILVLGATGPAGICLLRELIFWKHKTIAYARNPSKIPEDLVTSPFLEVVKGEMDDVTTLASAVARCNMILSLLGPNEMRPKVPIPYAGYYSKLFPIMREHGVKRIMAMSTCSADQSQDGFSLLVWLMVLSIRYIAPAAYQAMRSIARVFREEAQDLDWTVYRLAMIPGGHDEQSWKRDRESAVHAGYIGDGRWTYWTRRGAVARWLVDCAEEGQGEWIGKLPAISDGGKKEKAQ
ncbi:NAD(P)-binding protein [Whalleya microplaca]|nr:NAD(P)-binding protein [Whalleya microplaca]